MENFFKDLVSDDGKVTMPFGVHEVKISKIVGIEPDKLSEAEKKLANVGEKSVASYIQVEFVSKDKKSYSKRFYFTENAAKQASINLDHLLNKTVPLKEADTIKAKLAEALDKSKGSLVKFGAALDKEFVGKELKILLQGKLSQDGKSVFAELGASGGFPPFAERSSENRLTYNPDKDAKLKQVATAPAAGEGNGKDYSGWATD